MEKKHLAGVGFESYTCKQKNFTKPLNFYSKQAVEISPTTPRKNLGNIVRDSLLSYKGWYIVPGKQWYTDIKEVIAINIKEMRGYRYTWKGTDEEFDYLDESGSYNHFYMILKHDIISDVQKKDKKKRKKKAG